jgi:hypothetical protein
VEQVKGNGRKLQKSAIDIKGSIGRARASKALALD